MDEGHEEGRRLAALAALGLLAPPEELPSLGELEAVTRVAAALTGASHAVVNVIDARQQHQLAAVGFAGADCSREDSLCASHLGRRQTVHLPDASASPEHAGNPWVDGRLGAVRLYASAPLITTDGDVIGSLCVFDTVPGQLSSTQLSRLGDLAKVAISLFEGRRQARCNAVLAAETEEQRLLAQGMLEELEARAELTDAVLDTIDVAVLAAAPDGRLTLVNRAAEQWYGVSTGTAVGVADAGQRFTLFEADGTTPLAPERAPLLRALAEGSLVGAELVIAAPAGPARAVVASGRAMTRADGTPLGAVIAHSDVTTDRAQRHALQDLHDALAQRTAQLETEVAHHRDAQDQLAAANAQLHRALLLDGLTGLHNRPSLDAHLEREWRRHARSGAPLSVLMCDVDHFKAYNDTHGHLAGDECLRAIAACLGAALERGGDLAARYGGEEFTIVLAETDAAGALVVAERVRAAVARLAVAPADTPRGPEELGGPVTISIGVATWHPPEPPAASRRGSEPTRCAQDLLGAADRALYAAKAAGRDAVRVAV